MPRSAEYLVAYAKTMSTSCSGECTRKGTRTGFGALDNRRKGEADAVFSSLSGSPRNDGNERNSEQFRLVCLVWRHPPRAPSLPGTTTAQQESQRRSVDLCAGRGNENDHQAHRNVDRLVHELSLHELDRCLLPTQSAVLPRVRLLYRNQRQQGQRKTKVKEKGACGKRTCENTIGESHGKREREELRQ